MQKSSVNKVILVGHIGNKPEGRYTSNGISTASFSLATNESWIGLDNKRQERTEWHNIIAWNKLADFSVEYLVKGQLVYLEGRIQSRSYTDKDNVNRRITEIILTSITPLTWKNTDEGEKKNSIFNDIDVDGNDGKRDSKDKDLPF